MRRVLQFLATLVVLGAIWPATAALAMPGKQALSASGCQEAVLSAYEAPRALCMEVCQPASAVSVHQVQAPAFAADEPQAERHHRLLLPAASVARPRVALTQADPPAYLRFHRFLL